MTWKHTKSPRCNARNHAASSRGLGKCASHVSDVRTISEKSPGEKVRHPGCGLPVSFPGFRGEHVATVRGSRQSPRIPGRACRGGAGVHTISPDSGESVSRRCGALDHPPGFWGDRAASVRGSRKSPHGATRLLPVSPRSHTPRALESVSWHPVVPNFFPRRFFHELAGPQKRSWRTLR